MTSRRRQPPSLPPNHGNANNSRTISTQPQSSNIPQYTSSSSSSSPSSQWTPSQLLSSSYRDAGSPPEVCHKFKCHLLSSKKCLGILLNIMFTEIGKTGVNDYSLPIDMHDFLSSENPDSRVLANLLLRFPGHLLPLLEEAIVAAQRDILKRIHLFSNIANGDGNSDGNGNGNGNGNGDNHSTNGGTSKCNATVKGEHGTRVHARLTHLPPHSSNFKHGLSSLSSQDVGTILQFSGTVVRTSKVQMYESQRSYHCPEKPSSNSSSSNSNSSSNNNNGNRYGGNRYRKKESCSGGCGARFVVKADLLQWNNALVPPSRCPTRGCNNKNFKVMDGDGINNTKNKSDYQEIKVQESVGGANGTKNGRNRTGAIPKALLVKLQHDLVDKCQPGDDVIIVGTLISHWQNLVHMGDINIGTAIHAHSIRVVHGSGEGGADAGSSWDSIFDQNTNRDQRNNANDDDANDNNGGMGMVKDEIVNDFARFWNEDENKKRPIAARNFICQAICPTLYGMSLVKMALLLTLIGGSSSTGSGGDDVNGLQSAQGDHANVQDDDGVDESPVQFSLADNFEPSSLPSHSSMQNPNDTTDMFNPNTDRRSANYKSSSSSKTVQTRRREQSHLLLVGDPGCGKSQFLRFAAALCPRSVLTSGSGTTSAGLTCAAVRDETSKEWTLEAGALVLADRGVCAIDEFSCIAGKDRTTIHEAMEQQTLSVAKAGIVCKLNCRATVIAVTNAKGGFYDPEKPFSVNVGIEPPLLSRFDLVLKLIDGSDATKDDNVATFLLNRAIDGSGYACSKAAQADGNFRTPWNIDKLRAYIATLKSRFRPTISNDASILLRKHYTECRNSEYIEVQVTVRLLESLIRLAQAHARLMHRNVVELDDAVATVLLMECTVASTSMSSFNTLYTDPTTAIFPEDSKADIEFLVEKRKVLEKYEMLDLISADEMKLLEDHYSAMALTHQQQEQNMHSWENVGSSNDMMYSTNSANTFGNVPATSHHTGWSTQQDLYGRFTQQNTTPSPRKRASSFGNPSINEDVPFGNGDGSGKRTKRNQGGGRRSS